MKTHGTQRYHMTHSEQESSSIYTVCLKMEPNECFLCLFMEEMFGINLLGLTASKGFQNLVEKLMSGG